MSKLLSVVVPVFNEAATLPEFVAQTLAVLNNCGMRFELVFVNDGSRDNSLVQLIALSQAHPEVGVVDLSRNFGKEYALSAGLQFARGDAVVVMDADLQHPPEVIARFLEQWYAGYDVVYGVHHERTEPSRLKQWCSSRFYRLFNQVTKTQLPANVGDFRLMDRKVVDALNMLPERNRFMKGLFAWVGFRQTGVDYAQAERQQGESKWSVWKLWNFALDGLTGFTTLPLRLWSYLGLMVSALAMFYAVYLVVRTLVLGVDVPGYASQLVVILLLGGIQLVSLGVIGEYLGRLYHEAKGRPLYLVRSTHGLQPPLKTPETPMSAPTDR